MKDIFQNNSQEVCIYNTLNLPYDNSLVTEVQTAVKNNF